MTTAYLIMAAAGAILAAWAIRGFIREQRRAALLRRLKRALTGGRAVGYYPGSIVDPRD